MPARKTKKLFHYSKGNLHCEGVSLSSIAEEIGTPFYCYSRNEIAERFQSYQSALSGLNALICFAVKANSNIAVLTELRKLGAGFDLVSGGELFRVLKAGGDPGKIVFSGVGKTPGEMRDALMLKGRKGIFSFNVESIEELLTLNAVAKTVRMRARVALRFNPDVNPKTHPYISTGLKENKFGLTMDETLWIAKNADAFENIELCGLSIHIGSQMLELAPLAEAFQKFSRLAVDIETLLGYALETFDLGGGLGVAYQDHERAPHFSDYGKLIHQEFGKKSRWRAERRIVIEPGRSLVAPAGALITSVLYRKERKKKDILIVDSGMNDFIRPSLYDGHHTILPLEEKFQRDKKMATDVVGPICESGDHFAKNRLLPKSLGQGDVVALMNAGAYGATMSSHYNSKPKIPEILVSGKTFRVIRKRERYADLIRGESAQ